MAAGTVHLYDGAYLNLFRETAGTASRAWDDSTAGNIYWYLAGSGYTPADTHSTTTNVTNQVGGAGAPKAATNLVITKTPGQASETYFQGGANSEPGVVTFTDTGTVTAKWLIATQPTTAGSPSATTDRLIFYVDLNTASASATVSSTAGEFTVNMPTSGWFYVEDQQA